MRPGGIVGAITAEGGLNGKDLGRIDIYDTFSTVEIAGAAVPRRLRPDLRRQGQRRSRCASSSIARTTRAAARGPVSVITRPAPGWPWVRRSRSPRWARGSRRSLTWASGGGAARRPGRMRPGRMRHGRARAGPTRCAMLRGIWALLHRGGIVPADREYEREGLEFARAITFFDAIYAFSVTLLITTVDDFSPSAWSSLSALKEANGSSLLAFAISFVVVVRFWRVNHQEVTGYLLRLVAYCSRQKLQRLCKILRSWISMKLSL